jgi:hypothetical protein
MLSVAPKICHPSHYPSNDEMTHLLSYRSRRCVSQRPRIKLGNIRTYTLHCQWHRKDGSASEHISNDGGRRPTSYIVNINRIFCQPGNLHQNVTDADPPTTLSTSPKMVQLANAHRVIREPDSHPTSSMSTKDTSASYYTLSSRRARHTSCIVQDISVAPMLNCKRPALTSYVANAIER